MARTVILGLALCWLTSCGPPPPSCPPESPPTAPPAGSEGPSALAPPTAVTSATIIHQRFVHAAATFAGVTQAKIRTDGTGSVLKLALYHRDAAKVPENVTQMTTAAFPGATIQSYELELYRDHGWVFEVEVKTPEGTSCELAVLEAGTILYRECQIPIADLPPAIAQAVTAKLPGAKIVEAETKKGPAVDEIHVGASADGREHAFHFQPNGTLVRHLLKIPSTLEVTAP